MHTKQKKILSRKPHNTPGYTVEPYKAPKMDSRAIQSKQTTYTPYSNFEIFSKKRTPRVFPVFHVARGRKTLQTYGFPIQTYGKTLKGPATLILRRESKFYAIKFRVSTHSACPYKNYVPNCSQFPHELFYYFFST